MNQYVLIHPSQKFIPLRANEKIPATDLVPHGHHDALVGGFIPASWGSYKNFGLVLDGMYIVVDFDAEHPERDAFEAKLPKTWSQKTKKGRHYLFTVPEGYKGKNSKIKAEDGTILGDLKSLGYIVCPESVVDGHKYVWNGNTPVPAPFGLLEALEARERPSEDGMSFDIMPDGTRDNSLHRLGSAFRGVGYSQKAIESALRLLVQEGFVEQPEGREIEDTDIKRIARSAAKYETEIQYDSGPLLPSKIINGNDVAIVGPPTKWWLYGFVPQNELVTCFGKGGIGKSTFLSWLTALITKQGGKVGVCSIEEPFSRFLARVILCGGDRSLVYSFPNASQILFPRDAQALRELLDQVPLNALMFDSIYTHFESGQGLNMAERSRLSLSSLAEIAQTVGLTIIGNFHENKMGNYLGSVEMENVARVMLKMSRKKNKPLRVHVEKTNKRAPDYDLLFPGLDQIITDPETGEIQRETDKNGVLGPESITVAGDPEEVYLDEDEEDLEDESGDSVNLSNVELSKSEKADLINNVKYYKSQNPEKSIREIGEYFGISKSSVDRFLKIP